MAELIPDILYHPDATAFLAAAEPFLMQQEAHNALLLGLARAHQRHRHPSHRRRRPIYLTVHEAAGPVLAAVASPGQKLLLSWNQRSSESSLRALVRALASSSESVRGVFAEAALSQQFAHLWTETTGSTATPGIRQRLFIATEVRFPPRLPAGRLRPGTVLESELLSHWLLSLQLESLPREAGDLDSARIIVDGLLARKDLFVWEADGDAPRAVAMAAKARPVQRGIAINLVYTPPAERRRGYAAACVAHLTDQLLRDEWGFCTLFADSDNPSLDRLYESVGYSPGADFAEFHFSPGVAV